MEHQGNEQNGGLSVNAAVFIPRSYIPSLGTAPVQTIPTYMTNCFPFVQPDFNGNRHGNWSRNSRPRFGNRNSSGNHGNRPPVPNKFSEPPLFPFSSPPPPDPFFNHFMPPPNNVFMKTMTSLPVMPSGTDFNNGSDEYNANNNSFTSNNRRRRQDRNSKNNDRMLKENYSEEGRNFRRSNESLDENGRKFRRSNENINDGGRKFKRSNENINEGGRTNENSQRQQRRTNSGRKGGNTETPRSKVLVLYEREVQTDFSDSFSHLSLVQHPSSFYISSLHRQHLRHGEIAEYNLDADSGYSSPLHRNNQVSSSTQSDCVTPHVIFSNSIQSDDPSIVHAAKVPQQKFSYAFIAQKEPSPQPVINVENQKSVNRENYKDKRQKTVDRNNSGNVRKNSNQNTWLDSKSTNRNTENRSHDYKDSYNTNSLKYSDLHTNKNNSKQFSDKNQDETQSTSNQRKKYGQKHTNNSDQNIRGDHSKIGSARNEENDYGFSRTKNLHTDKQGDRRNFQDSKYGKKSLQEEKLQQNDKNSANEKSGDINKTDDNCEPGKKKRRRRRRGKNKSKDGDQDSQDEGDSEMKQEIELHFEDVEEFPDLSSARASEHLSTGLGISYSAILQTIPSQKPHIIEPERNNRTSSSEDSPRKDNSVQEVKGTRASRRRKKRKDILNKEAENELAEISLEQQMLKEQCLKTTGQKPNKDEKGQTPGILKINPKSQPAGKKSKQNVSLDLGAVIDALEQKKTTISLTSAVPRKEQKPKQEQAKKKETQKSKGSHNVLDANAPVKRGKERETPKQKKPSPLKKVILKEREEKKHLRMLDGPESVSAGAVGIGVVSAESDLSQDAMSTKSSVDYTGTPGSANLSPVSQTSPISMSPLSPGTSPISSEVNSPIAGAVGKDVIRKIHSRRFREYCNQVLDKDIDECATTLLQDLVRFQDRMYHKDPSKAKLKRRLVLGLREVAKHLKLKKIKCVIISPNLEKIQSKGGLDDALNNILNLCNEQNVPFVFALGRRALGRACAKLVPVSVVGIFNYSGSEENFKQLIDLTEKARESYGEMVDAIEKEIKEYPIKIQQPSIPHVFAHMGHSRTPSGASVLSFTSSILSEPISENYPHSEPETDSKGYEIIKDDALIKQGLPTSPSGYQTQMRIIHSNRRGNLDDGNEADNEEEAIKINKGGNLRTSEEDLSLAGSDMVSALPHIDSIHSSSTHDLNTEILSQHSGRTLENCEAMSTHSSRTLGDGSSTMLADMGDRSKHGTPKSTESPSNTLQRGKVVDEERIQHWVDETSSRLESLALEEESYEDSSDDMTDSENDSSDDIKECFALLGRECRKNEGQKSNNDYKDNNQLRNTNLQTEDNENLVTEKSNLHNNEKDSQMINLNKSESENLMGVNDKNNENNTNFQKHECDNLNVQKLENGVTCSICGREGKTSSRSDANLSDVSPAYVNDCDKFLTGKQENFTDSNPHNPGEDHSGTINRFVNSLDTACDKNNDDEINSNDQNATAPENVEIHFD